MDRAAIAQALALLGEIQATARLVADHATGMVGLLGQARDREKPIQAPKGEELEEVLALLGEACLRLGALEGGLKVQADNSL